MKKRTVSFLLLLALAWLIAFSAAAELSTNLRTVSTMDRAGRNVVRRSYVDQNGQLTVASDKGYATVEYTYATRNRLTRVAYKDADENPTNCVGGYAVCRWAFGCVNNSEAT